MKNLTKKGFTLVELLVVISIIGLLSTIAIVSLGSARQKARDTKRIADMKQVSTALEQYYADKGGYPAVKVITTPIVLGSTNAKVLVSNVEVAAGEAPSGGNYGSFSTTLATGRVYMGNIPSYPTPGQSGAKTDCSVPGAAYCYTSGTAWTTTSGPTATTYSMTWQLEAANPAAGLGSTNCTTTTNGVTCG